MWTSSTTRRAPNLSSCLVARPEAAVSILSARIGLSFSILVCICERLPEHEIDCDLLADWNPASDQQALARVWRDGQKKECMSPASPSQSMSPDRVVQASSIASSQPARSKRRSSSVRRTSKPYPRPSSTRRKTWSVISRWTR